MDSSGFEGAGRSAIKEINPKDARAMIEEILERMQYGLTEEKDLKAAEEVLSDRVSTEGPVQGEPLRKPDHSG